jgi:serine/threonine protein kinase
MTIEKGSTIGPYVIEATLGHGGMGVVYRAAHTRLGRAVAIKVLKTLEHDPIAIARFEREARVTRTSSRSSTSARSTACPTWSANT